MRLLFKIVILSIGLISCTEAQIFPRFVTSQSGAIPKPNYGILSGVELVLESHGLEFNATNLYGTTSGTGSITTWNSLSPSPLGRNFGAQGATNGATLQVVNGIRVIECNGTASLRSGSAATWNFLSYNSTFANMRWTIHMLARAGFGSDPGEAYSFIGSNGGSAARKGITEYYDDRTTNNNTLGTQIGKGTTGFISNSVDANKVTPNEWHVYTWTFDASQTAANRQKFYIDGVNVAITVTSASTAVVTTPTYNLELMASGNITLPTAGQISHVVIQSVVENSTVQSDFINSLLVWKNALSADYSVDAAGNPSGGRSRLYNTTQGDLTKYYFGGGVFANPTTPGTLVKVYRVGSDHIPDASCKLVTQKSTDYGVTWSAERDFYDPDGAGVLAAGDLSCGFDPSGRLWVANEVRTTTGTDMKPFYAKVIYSDDNGDTAGTVIDITASIPADGIDLFNFHGQFIKTHTGRYIFPFYKVNNTASSSANYVMYCDAGCTSAGNWNYSTTRAPGSAYINESNMVEVTNGGTNRLIQYIRSDVTFEYNAYSSTDDGATWTDHGAQSFGETFTTASPGTFSKFTLNGQSVVVFYYSDRGAARSLKSVYAKETSLATVSATTSFDLDTKTFVYPDQLSYGNVAHPYNNIFGVGAYMRDPQPFTGTENKFVTITTQTNNKDLIISELGL